MPRDATIAGASGGTEATGPILGLMKFLRTIRLDTSDLYVFERAAEPGEWAVSGSFAFAEVDPADLGGKLRQAFANGWLGLDSLGYSTLVEVAEIGEADYEGVIERLADLFVRDYGAPSREAALPVAREEAAYAAGLCEHKPHTLLALERELTDAGIVERFRVIVPSRAEEHAKIWTIVDD